jgi:hypothetical protein
VTTASLARYRHGEYKAGAELAEAFLRQREGSSPATADDVALRLVAALCLAKAGKPEQARPYFAQACQRMDTALLQPSKERRPAHPAAAWAANTALRREAEQALGEAEKK